jgi:ribosomal protein S18 acetylase RimI-like enzyme
MYESPRFEMGKSVLLVEDLRGALVALIKVLDEAEPPVHPQVWMSVDPDFEALGIEEYLLEWAEERATQVLDRVEPDLRIAMRLRTHSLVKSFQRPLQEANWRLIRSGYTMRIDMDKAPPEPFWPEGIRLKPYDPEQEARHVYQADEEANQDHFGFIREDPEKGFQRFMHNMTGDDSYDPSLWFLAVEGEEIVGFCICRKYGAEDPETGYVSSLGVRRPWRRRGVARAMLLQAFGEYYRCGRRNVELGVDAESLTGALDLYKKVGMHIHRQYDLYEKVVRPGKDISVNQLEDLSQEVS